MSCPLCFMVFLSLWFSALQKRPEDINRRSADMWSFAVLLWELVTREVPFADLSQMEIGMKVSGHSIYLPTGLVLCVHISVLLKDCATNTIQYLQSIPGLFLVSDFVSLSLCRWLLKVFGQPFPQGFLLIFVS